MSDEISNSNDSAYRESVRVNRSSLDRGGRLIVPQRGTSATSQVKPPFQQVMDQMRGPGDSIGGPATPRQAEGTENHQPLNPVNDHPERQSSFRDEMQRRGRETEEFRPARSSSTEGEKPRGKMADQRVIARAPLSERQREGQGKGEGQSGKGGSRHGQGSLPSSTNPLTAIRSLQKGKIQDLGSSTFLQNLKGLTPAAGPRVKTPLVFSKALLDQLVRYVQLMVKPNGEKEMDVSLHEKVFKGLRLKVALVRDKAEATFFTTTSEVRELFLAHRRDIEEALKEKGIEVREINVIMTPRV